MEETKPKTVISYGGGIYSKPRCGRDGIPYSAFFVRVWVSSEKHIRVFRAGRTLKSARRLRDRIVGDPSAAVERRRQLTEQAHGGLTVTALYKTFVGAYRSRGGTKYYVTILRPVAAALGNVRVCDLTVQTFDAYLRKRRSEQTKGRLIKGVRVGGGERRISESTLRKETIAAARMLKWARQRGLVTVDPFRDYERPKESAGAPARALTFEEEDRLLAVLPPMERDIVAWGLDSGMRIGEILALTWARIDRAAGVIHVVGTKTAKVRILPLDLSDRLTAILSRRPRHIGSDLVFCGRDGGALNVDRLNVVLRGAMKAAGVPKTRGALWNVLRKTTVSRLYANGALPQQEADWLGHSMGVATRHYRELSPVGRDGATGLLNRVATVATTVARKAEIA